MLTVSGNTRKELRHDLFLEARDEVCQEQLSEMNN